MTSTLSTTFDKEICHQMRRLSYAVSLLTLALIVAGCRGAEAPKAKRPTLRFTAIPDQNTTELQEKFRPLADYLSRRLGVPVEYVPVRDYQAAVESFKNGD